jgi:O-antigen/teichoic acid export membrane protein
MISKTVKTIKNKKVLMKILSSSFLSLPVSILVAAVSFRYIDPEYMGIWAVVTIVETYSNIVRLGIVNGMNRELPHALGKGEKGQAIKYAQTTLAYTILVVFLTIVASPFLLSSADLKPIYLWAMIVGVTKIVLNQYMSYIGGTFRTTDNFNKLSNIQFIVIGSRLLFIPLIIAFGFVGYIIMQLLVVTLNSLLLYLKRPFPVKPKFHKESFFTLFKTGFPIFLSSYAISFVATFPKLFILKYGTVTLLGLYAPVFTLITAFSAFPNALSTYYYPRLSYQLGKGSSPYRLFISILKVYGVSILLVIVLLIGIYLFIDYFPLLFPKYKESLPILKLSLFIGPFIVAKLGNLINIILKKVNFMSYYVGFYAFFQLFYLFLFYFLLDFEVLYAAVYSQIFTFLSLLLTSIGLNLIAIKSYSDER